LIVLAVAAVAVVTAPSVSQGRYAQLCDAILRNDRAALTAILARDFRSVDASGKVYARATFVSDLTDAGPIAFKRCAYDVISRHAVKDGERDRAILTYKGTYTAQGSAQPFTALAETENSWVWRAGRWQLRTQQTFRLKQWVGGVSLPTETYVPPLSPAERAAVIADVRTYARPLRSAYPGTGDADLAPVLRAAGDARVVAMGEGSHGTSEFFALKDRVFRYLVERGGVTVFAQETNWSDGANIEQYLQTGKGNLRDLLAATFAVWNNQETFDLLQWMRAYDVAHPHALHFFGIDMQFPKEAAERVVEFYKKYEPENAKRVAEDEACVEVPFMTLYKTAGAAAKCVAPTHEAFQTIASDARLEQTAGHDAYLDAYHAAEVAQEAPRMWAAQGLPRQAGERDAAMAHNVEWMLGSLYPRARVFLWAHNAHVGVGVESWKSMGTYLRKSLGSNYFAIGQTFDHGDLSIQRSSAYVPSSIGNGSEVIFRQAGISPFFLNFADLPPESAISKWLAEPRGIREIGAVWKASDVPDDEPAFRLPIAFDAITFVDAAHAAHSFDLEVHRSVAFPGTASGWASTVRWTFRTFAADDANGGAQILPDGKPALYLAATPAESNLSAWIDTHVAAAAYRGKTIRLRGMLATSSVTIGSSMSVGAYGSEIGKPLTAVARDPAPAMTGTNPWTPVDITFAVPQNAETIDVQFLLKGAGTAWVSDLSLSNAVGTK
jgi:erythromycin esterase